MHPNVPGEGPPVGPVEPLAGEAAGDDHQGRVGRVARGVGVGSFGQVIGRILGFVVRIVLARVLTLSLLGSYVLGLTVVSLANVLAQVGLDNGVVRYVSHHRATGDDARVKGTIIQALLVSFALSVLLAAALFFGAPFLAGFFEDEFLETNFLENAFKGFSFSLPFLTVMSMALWATQGFQTVKYTALVQQVVQPIANLALVVLFYLVGVEFYGAVAAYVISMALGSALALRYLWKVFPKIGDRQVAAVFETRDLFRVSGPMILSGFMRNLNTWTSTFVLAAFASAGAVALYDNAARTALLAGVIVAAFNGIFSPMVADLYRRGQMHDLDALYKDVSRWVFTGSLIFFLSTLLLAKDVMSVFGSTYVPAWPVLVIVAGAQLFSASVGSTGRVLAMTDRQWTVMYANVGAVALNVALNLLLVPLYDIVGSAAATAVAMCAANAVTLTAVRRSLGLWPYTGRYLKPIAAGVAAVAVAYAFRLLFQVPTGIAAVPLVGGVYALAFVAGLLLLGLDASDRQFVKAGWNAVRYKLKIS